MIHIQYFNMESKFKVDDEVRMLPESRFWYCVDDPGNPKDMLGVITKIEPEDSLPIKVKWNNGFRNSYGYEDLKIVDKEPVTNETYSIF